MPSLTVENYLKTALLLSMETESEWVSTGELAMAMNVAPGTVTAMLKTLAEAGLANYKPYEGARLTAAGKKLALRMLRRHRLIEQFLADTLNLTWDRVHEEAENMEHAVSDFLVDRIDEYLGHPEYDPHGDPIPTADGQMRGDPQGARPLSQCPAGSTVRFARVIDQEAEFLRYLTGAGIEVGTVGTVTENNMSAGTVTTTIGRKSISMGHSAAEKILVETIAG